MISLSRFPALRATAVLGAALFLSVGAAHADATLDRIKQRGKVAIGVVVSGGPFGSIDPATQQLVGWNPDLARDLAKQLGAELELVQVQPSTRVQFLQSGKVDLLIASMEYNADRGEILGHAPTPFYRVGGTAAVLKTSGIAKWEDLRGKIVCASQGSSYVKPLQEQYGAQVRGFKTSAESLLALRGGNCAAAVHDATLIQPLLRSSAEWAAYAAPIRDEILPAPSVVWTRKGEADTIAAVDKVVKQWHRSGWLIETEKRNGIEPPQPLLPELQARLRAAP
ncbi:transporter substrate-binding domain-containing protein [Variovorax sp. J22G21]|uniref:transporter substrate-binding domain-containing protein n=1 Tax=Variovorax fucosicus TaxID=3053517 RepID=UPI0025773976|nr:MULTISPECIES: transporter substrate-binding domain-containing protein [unclassified Variovorax]MDM0037593.1 transporter substrate-binding domain-containing protein [Variovorax sp. J22R193]MDM0056737.1 transporter substrate-binding domain-containing protein [Variovorax sp. J22G47]MDM0062369.1 transporter substrate-binding domain-containing protein [Variovorax sp. J22G21]